MRIDKREYKPEPIENIYGISAEKAEKNSQAATMHDRLMKSFGSGILKRVYPSYYGGAYINENDDYVINIVEGSSDWEEDLELRIDMSNTIINFVKYSLSSLREERDRVAQMVFDNKTIFQDNFVGFGISNRLNKINVYVNDTGMEIQSMLLDRVTESDMFRFISSGKIELHSTDLYAGGDIQEGSIAYRAKYGNTEGVVTAAHVVQYNNYIHTTGGTSIGQCTSRQFIGPADAAFCAISNLNTFSPTNTIAGSNATLSTILSDPPEGSYIYKRGHGTNIASLTSGYITDDDYSYYAQDSFSLLDYYYLQNLTLATYDSEIGNSGGLIYRLSGSTRYTVGVHHGKVTAGALYSKATNVADTLFVTRY
ncbi:MAG: hypothetical protein E7295_03900 [Lachnospiraceae bacterium]|jgi:uncharacterized protein (DUF1919 family)|nr:hypothetical protein [Lachnospiraceae bacterium]